MIPAVPGGTPLLQAGVLNWTAVGSLIALITAIGGAAYTYGKQLQASSSREDDIEANAQELEAMSYELRELRNAVRSLGKSFDMLREEITSNREDIRDQHKLVHDQILGDGEECGNPRCVFCHPENTGSGVDIDTPFGDSETFDTHTQRFSRGSGTGSGTDADSHSPSGDED